MIATDHPVRPMVQPVPCAFYAFTCAKYGAHCVHPQCVAWAKRETFEQMAERCGPPPFSMMAQAAASPEAFALVANADAAGTKKRRAR